MGGNSFSLYPVAQQNCVKAASHAHMNATPDEAAYVTSRDATLRKFTVKSMDTYHPYIVCCSR